MTRWVHIQDFANPHYRGVRVGAMAARNGRPAIGSLRRSVGRSMRAIRNTRIVSAVERPVPHDERRRSMA